MTPQEDEEQARSLYRALAGSSGDNEDTPLLVTVPGPPVSKARTKFGSGQVYSTKEARAAERRTATYLRQVVRQPFPGNVMVACVFYRPNRQRIDVDNMLKHVCDSANGVLWADDCQATSIAGIAELDRDNPRTLIVVGVHRSTLLRGEEAMLPCQQCGTLFSIVGRSRSKPKRYCSQACVHLAAFGRRQATAKVCEGCGKTYSPNTAAQRFCGRSCASAAREKTKTKTTRLCTACGGPVSHMSRGTCRPCFLASIRAQRKVG